MNEEDRPWIGNIGVYRLYAGYEPHHMTARFLYRKDSPHWTEEERSAIKEFRQGWKPEWEAPGVDGSILWPTFTRSPSSY